MANITADRVQETSVTVGAGAYTLAGAVTGYQAFSAVCANADTCDYYAEDVDANGKPSGGWEVGQGTWGTGGILTRTSVYASSNAGSAVSWAAGTRRVALGLTSHGLGTLVPKTTTVNGHALSGNVTVTAADVSAVPYTGATSNVDLGAHNLASAQHTITDTVAAGSGSLAGSALNIAQTWNTTGAPTALLLNVTNTASGATSKLLDLQVGGTTQFNVRRDGLATIASAVFTGNVDIGNAVSGVGTRSVGIFSWSSSASNPSLIADTSLSRISAGIIGVGTGAQGSFAGSIKLTSINLGVATPSALLHIAAGTAAAGTAPFKYTSGVLQTTPEAGADEFVTDTRYFTITTGAARKKYLLAELSGAPRIPSSGAAATAGNSALVAGTVTVSTTGVTANSVIMLTRKTAGGVLGNLTYTTVAGTSFTINSDNIADTSTVSWVIFEGI